MAGTDVTLAICDEAEEPFHSLNGWRGARQPTFFRTGFSQGHTALQLRGDLAMSHVMLIAVYVSLYVCVGITDTP